MVTGEGMTDRQSAFGKTISGIAAHCQRLGVPVVRAFRRHWKRDSSLYELGVDTMMSAVCRPMGQAEACECAEILFSEAADRMFRLLQVGMKIKK